jgi:glycosyltransferase involved in cell wall biosynthesis
VAVRLLFVPPRFGDATVGGAERLVHALATRAIPDGWSAEIATTCARNHYTWANELPPGESVEDGLVVRRFPVGPRDAQRYETLHARIVADEASYAEELEWLGNSVWSPELDEFLQAADGYDLVVLAPYLFGTTLWGAQVAPDRSALIPCLHDEPYARLRTVGAVIASVRGCLLNSPAEERLVRRLFRIEGGGVVGMGFDEPEGLPRTAFAAPRDLGPFVLYAGRIEEGKRVDVAVDYATRYAAERANAPRLALIGSGTYELPEESVDTAFYAGFLGEDERRAAYAEALALVNPSHMESLSIVLMEAWLEGTPALVAAGSEVLREHVERSGGGLVFGDYDEYREAVDRLVGEPGLRGELGAAGRAYVLDTYSWPAVRTRFRETVEALVA